MKRSLAVDYPKNLYDEILLIEVPKIDCEKRGDLPEAHSLLGILQPYLLSEDGAHSRLWPTLPWGPATADRLLV